jgi:hypothetical protein
VTGIAEGTRKAWLVLGGLHLLNGTAPARDSDPVVLVPLARPVEAEAPANTVIVSWAELGPVELRARPAVGAARHTEHATGSSLFPDMLPGKELAAAAAAVAGEPDAGPGPGPGSGSGSGSDRGAGPGPLVPLFYLSATDAGVHVYTQIRFLAEDACFIRLTPEPLAAGQDPEDLTWLPAALELHARQFLFLNNHQRYYRKLFGGNELEYKYTLDGPDSWTLTVEMQRRIRAGGLPGYVMEYRDEFQAWDYLNHLFDVVGPDGEEGYVSFIRTTDGRHLVKRKWYRQDTFNRRETHTYGVQVEDDGGFEAYVEGELGVESVRLPSFRRVRYDVNFESVRTGHVYGIFFDHCSLVAAPHIILNQCELEYLRSRTAVEPEESAVLAEMAEIAAWLEDFLREHGLDATRGFYSKRTFLQEAVAAHGELRGVR